MILTNKQEQGLKIAVERYHNNEKYTTISGYAGSGKSTLVRFIVAALNVDEESVCYATFTGKAAQVLLKKGNRNVCTLHKLLFEHFPRPDGTFFRRPVPDIPYDIVIVDECSMAPKDLVNQLLKYDVYVIFLGDPGQLPPINPDDDNHLLDKPHVFLDEIMRQAQESEIIRLSMDIRAGNPLPLFNGKDVKIFDAKDLNTGMLQWADQIICATNQKRVALNNQMRGLLGHEDGPREGDKVICLRNYWENIASGGDPLVNGTIGYLSNVYESFVRYPAWINGGGSFDVICGNFTSDSGAEFNDLTMDKKLITEGVESIDWKTKYALSKNMRTRHMVPFEFTYGYAITCHKSQGSQWDKVLVCEENFPFAKEEHKRWLYTAATRAAEKLVIIRK